MDKLHYTYRAIIKQIVLNKGKLAIYCIQSFALEINHFKVKLSFGRNYNLINSFLIFFEEHFSVSLGNYSNLNAQISSKKLHQLEQDVKEGLKS